ncbi:MAG: division/cell wall cluster transcriptional repressor MraZ [Xanthomonadales bacterium]|nr:division/cell wall cluster transcriptional repressor MraZ [Xanthomonadales bacterium]
MFYGETAISLDAKGRMAIPARYREQIDSVCQGRLVLTYNAFDNDSLWLYPEAVWSRVRDQVMGLSSFDSRHRALQRRLVGSAAEIGPDGSGRIQIPATLREVANLEKRVVLMGLGSKFEIWNEEVLNRTRFEQPLTEPTEEISKLVI